MTVYMCQSDKGHFLGLFTTRQIAEESWRISYSSISTVTFEGDKVLYHGKMVGAIIVVPVNDRPDHL
jgi:hypothetical protein